MVVEVRIEQERFGEGLCQADLSRAVRVWARPRTVPDLARPLESLFVARPLVRRHREPAAAFALVAEKIEGGPDG